MAGRSMTLGEFVAARVGIIKGTKVLAFIYAWGVYSEKEPTPHTLDGYAKFWRQSISSTYRERDLFQICWPDEKVPARVWASVADQVQIVAEGRRRDVNVARLFGLSGVWE